ncbi:MAG: AAA family ATPase [Patescibacteria group bacterium]
MNKYPILILIRGLPGSGKSSISLELVKRMDGKVIDPDLISAIRPKSYRNERLRKFRLCTKNARSYLNKKLNVIWCQPFRKAQNIELVVNSLGMDYLNSFLVDIKIPLEVSWIRSRNKFFNDREIFNEFVSKCLPIPPEYKIPTLTLNGEDEVSSNVNKVLAFIGYNTSDE